MMPFEVYIRTLDGHRRTVAVACRVCPTLVNGWCRPPRSAGGDGENSPLQRLLETILALRAAQSTRSEEIFLYLAEELGYIAVRIDSVPNTVNLIDAAELMTGTGAYLTAFSEARADGVITASEAASIADALRNVMAASFRQDVALRNVIAADDEQQVRRRMGPKRALPRLMQLRRRTA